MSFIVVGIAAAAGVAQIGMALSGSKKRKTEQKAAAADLANRKSEYEQMDTSNPYANMENTMEDLTVAQNQSMERQGDARSQDKKQEKTETLLGMAQGRKGAADAARQRARDQVSAGIGTIGAAGVGAARAVK